MGDGLFGNKISKEFFCSLKDTINLKLFSEGKKVRSHLELLRQILINIH